MKSDLEAKLAAFFRFYGSCGGEAGDGLADQKSCYNTCTSAFLVSL